MLRRDFIRWLVRITGGYFVINMAPGLSPLKRINTTMFREAMAQDSCTEDTCTTQDDCGATDTEGHTCTTKDVCDVDASKNCTNDECTSDSSGTCSGDRCVSDSSGDCTNDGGPATGCTTCDGDTCSTCDADSGCTLCDADTCTSCDVDTCGSDTSGYCSSDSSGPCTNDSCVSDKSGACKNDTCEDDASGSGGGIDPSCEEDFTEGSGSDDCVSDSSGSCLVDKCNTDISDACTQQDVCVLDESGACDSDLCREDRSPACTASDTCSKDIAMNDSNATRRYFAKAGINSAIKWLYRLSMITLFVGMVYGTSHAETVIDSTNAVFSPSATYNTSQSVSVPDPVGPFLRDCDDDGILEADTNGDGLCDGDPEVMDYNGDGTREFPDSTTFLGNFEFTCFHIPDDVAIISTGALSIKVSEEVAIFGAMRLTSGAEMSTPGKIDLRTSAWLSGTVTSIIFNTALPGEVDETQTAYGNEDSVPDIEYTSVCVSTPTPTPEVTPTPEPTPEPSPEPSPEPTPSPSPQPSPTEPPTAIELASFKAKANNDGSVTLKWRTATEVDNAGFNIYRKRRGGSYTKVNSTLIPAEGNSTAGASYSYEDTPGIGTFYYKLEDKDTKGVSTMHGPVRVKVTSDDDVKARKR